MRVEAITGSVVAIERQDETGDNQYLLRSVLKDANGAYVLRANNPNYKDMAATEDMRTLARLKAVIDPLELAVGEAFMREDFPGLFRHDFNPGNWNVGHVTLPDQRAHVLMMTLNKQGSAQDHRYLDHWIDPEHFNWQSQNATTPASKSGQEIIDHENRGIEVHQFIREHKLAGGKSTPFLY